MSKKRNTIPETGENTQITVSGRGNGRNGHKHPSQPLSWYLAEPRAKGLMYVLTANGYVILPTDIPGSRKEIDTSKLMM